MSISDKISIIIDRIADHMGRGLQPNEKRALVDRLTAEWEGLKPPPESAYMTPSGRLDLVSNRCRDHLPEMLNRAGLTGTGAEIGVFRGDFSHTLLSVWKGERLYLVDAWKHFPEGYQDALNVSDDEQEERYKSTVARLSEFGERAHILRMLSEDAADLVPDGTLDFVYIDANHGYEHIRKDIELWWPKVKPGGILSGHDYIHGRSDIGVPQAVDEFLEANGLRAMLLTDGDCSWVCVKPPNTLMEVL